MLLVAALLAASAHVLKGRMKEMASSITLLCLKGGGGKGPKGAPLFSIQGCQQGEAVVGDCLVAINPLLTT